MGDFVLTSEGDFEVVLLYENHSLLAELISPSYYKTIGSPPTEVQFYNASSLWNFFVHVDELISSGTENVVLGGKRLSFSLLGAAEWLCSKYPQQVEQLELHTACNELLSWLNQKREFSFWCPGLDRTIMLELSRRQVINFGANLGKHRLLRLGGLMGRLRDLCSTSGEKVQAGDVVALREPFLAEVENRLVYLASWLVELLGRYFTTLNAFIIQRFEVEQISDSFLIRVPIGVTSDAMRSLYGSTLVFKRYDKERIERYVPKVPELLKARY